MSEQSEEANIVPPANPDLNNHSGGIPSNIETVKESQQNLENMEVHHHAHHEHGKKNWKSYLQEFLMLFLAVFCGFLAEYKLEHVIEHQRERKYMQLMIQDLQEDTTQISLTIKRINNLLIPAHKTSTALLFNEKYDNNSIREMYIHVPSSLLLLSLNFQDVTSTQLKNSGNLRLIENTAVTNQLSSYWSNCNRVKTSLLSSYDKTRIDSKDLFFSLFNLSNYTNNSAFAPLKADASCKLISDDKNQLIRLGNNISNLESQLSGPFELSLREIQTQATELIVMIRKEYRIDNQDN